MKIAELAEFLGGVAEGDGDREITGVAALDSAGASDLSFVDKSAKFSGTKAGCLIVGPDFDGPAPSVLLRVGEPKLAFARAAAKICPPERPAPSAHPSAVIAPTASIGGRVSVGPFATVGEHSTIGDGSWIGAGSRVGDNVVIGRGCTLHANVVVENGCTIGDNVILHAGAVIGADGFGYVRGPEGHVKFPQIGTVVIENDVEIGANTCIDRGALGETRIGEGTKIDNLVQIAHNVSVGRRVVIAALTGISGSSVIGDDCVLAGQVGIADHVRLMPGAVIGAQSAVFPGKIVRPGVWCGTPVQPLDEYKRRNALSKSIARLREEVRELKRRLGG